MARKLEEFVASSVRFIGEQDGEPERVLKAKLAEYFVREGIRCRAYLARVEYGASSDFNVALCMASETESADVAADVGHIFGQLFQTDEHLDVIMLSNAQEAELKAVARPFFSADDGVRSVNQALSHD